MKSPKQVINDTIKKLQIKHKNQHLQSPDNNDNSLGPFDLIPIHFTGMIEDYLFRESRQIFDILKEDADQDIEGLTYNEIRNDIEKNLYYDKVRLNIPKYYSFKPSDRQKHFDLEGELYFKKLGIKPEQIVQSKGTQTANKAQAQQRDPTPMKQKGISKKQALKTKKQQKKNAATKTKQVNDLKKDQNAKSQANEARQQKFNTPQKKPKQKKKVKFFEFEYVKDFSQYKTPKRLALAEQIIEPLKEIELSQKGKE